MFNTEKGPGFIDLTGEASRESRPPRIPFAKSTDQESQGTDYLTLEAEVQDLMEQVTVLESGQAHIIDLQRSIMRNQDQIFRRLAALENKSYHRPLPFWIPPPPRHTPRLLDSSFNLSFESPRGPVTPRNDPPLYIPPPPAHAASHDRTPLSPYTPRRHSPPPHLDDDDYLGLDAFGDENDGADLTLSTSHPPPHHSSHQNNFQDHTTGGESHLGTSVSNHLCDVCPPPRNPLQPLRQNYKAPPKRTVAAVKLPSSVINKGQLLQATTVFRKYPGLVYESKIGTLATKLAKEAFFGDDVLVQCTVAGERDHPGLPEEKLMQLKHAIFMQFPRLWNSPQEFEPLWKKCQASIGQVCKRLRINAKV